MKKKYKMIIIIVFFIFIALFFKYEQKLVFIKYLPITMKMSVVHEIENHKIVIPLHKLTFIKDMDFFLKSSITYFTFLDSKKINDFYDAIKENAKTKYKTYESQDIFMYYDEKNNTYTIIPILHINNEKDLIKNVTLKLIDKNLIKEIIENGAFK